MQICRGKISFVQLSWGWWQVLQQGSKSRTTSRTTTSSNRSHHTNDSDDDDEWEKQGIVRIVAGDRHIWWYCGKMQYGNTMCDCKWMNAEWNINWEGKKNKSGYKGKRLGSIIIIIIIVILVISLNVAGLFCGICPSTLPHTYARLHEKRSRRSFNFD